MRQPKKLINTVSTKYRLYIHDQDNEEYLIPLNDVLNIEQKCLNGFRHTIVMHEAQIFDLLTLDCYDRCKKVYPTK